MDTEQVRSWYKAHSLEYALTEKRLADTKAKFLSANWGKQYDMLRASYVNAVMSQQTPVDRHEAAYVTYRNGTSLKESLKLTLYANQKFDWITSTDIIQFAEVIDLLNDGHVTEAENKLAADFVGLGPMKAAFTLAMLGFTKCMCLDTNVQQLTGITCRTKSMRVYREKCDEVCQMYDIDLAPFMLQWCLFDCNRGMHATHEVWFRDMGTWCERIA